MSAGTFLVASRKARQVWMIDPSTWRVRGRAPTRLGSREIAVSPDGRRAAVANYGGDVPGTSVTVLDVEACAPVRTIELGPDRRPHGIVWPDGDRIFVTSERTRSVLGVDVSSGEVFCEIPTLEQGSHMMVASPDGRRAFVSSLGGAVAVLDLEAGEAARHVPVDAGAEGLALTAAGELWVAHRVTNRLTVLDVDTLETRAVLSCPGYPIRLSVAHGDSRLLAACPKRAEVAVFDTRERREVHRVCFDRLAGRLGILGRVAVRLSRAIPFGVSVHPDGDLGVVAHPKADRLTLLDLATGRVTGRHQVCAAPDGMAWSPVGVAGSGA